jgi:hypothetical protein
MLIEKALINAMVFLMVTIGIHYRKFLTTLVNIYAPNLGKSKIIGFRTTS